MSRGSKTGYEVCDCYKEDRAEWLVPGWHSGSFEDLGNASVLLIWAPLYILHLI